MTDATRVRALCDEIGYGFTIAFASAMWAQKQWGDHDMAEWLRSLADCIDKGETLEQRMVRDGDA